ncbi:MAG: carbonic anhydrase [Pseudomonadales bacterium]|jgi:carbonic anhydrase
MVNALEALEMLQVGNRRFIEGRQSHGGMTLRDQMEASAREQTPFAIIIGCSDSRVPAEIVFDQGIGDLFVIRVAGNVVAPSQIGSVEFAAEQFGTELVVVLGHSNCGAVAATIDQLHQPTENRSPNLHSIVDRIRPSIQGLLGTNLEDDPEALMRAGVRANVRSSVAQLRSGSQILEALVQKDRLNVVGAEYSLSTGLVEFFEGVH